MNNRCKDLLDMDLSETTYHSPSGCLLGHETKFLHRCVGDFFREHYTTTLEIQATKSGPFDAKLTLAAMYVVFLRSTTTYFEKDGCVNPSFEYLEESFSEMAFEDCLRSFLTIAAEIDKEISAGLDSIPAEKGHRIMSLPQFHQLDRPSTWCLYGTEEVLLTLAERIRDLHALIDEVKAIVSALLIALGLLDQNGSQAPVEDINFARLALTARLNTYVKQMVSKDMQILDLYPQLLCFAVRPVRLEYFLPVRNQHHPGLFPFFKRYMVGHPGEISAWSKAEKGLSYNRYEDCQWWMSVIDHKQTRFLLDAGGPDIVSRSFPPAPIANRFAQGRFDLEALLKEDVEQRKKGVEMHNPAPHPIVKQPLSLWSFFLASLLALKSDGGFEGESRQYLQVAALLIEKGGNDMDTEFIPQAENHENPYNHNLKALAAIRDIWPDDQVLLIAQLENKKMQSQYGFSLQYVARSNEPYERPLPRATWYSERKKVRITENARLTFRRIEKEILQKFAIRNRTTRQRSEIEQTSASPSSKRSELPTTPPTVLHSADHFAPSPLHSLRRESTPIQEKSIFERIGKPNMVGNNGNVGDRDKAIHDSRKRKSGDTVRDSRMAETTKRRNYGDGNHEDTTVGPSNLNKDSGKRDRDRRRYRKGNSNWNRNHRYGQQ